MPVKSPASIGIDRPMRGSDYNIVERQRARLNVSDHGHLAAARQLGEELTKPIDQPWALGSCPEETPPDHSLELQGYDSLDEFHSIPADKSLEEEFMSAREYLPLSQATDAKRKPSSPAYATQARLPACTVPSVVTQQPLSALAPQMATPSQRMFSAGHVAYSAPQVATQRISSVGHSGGALPFSTPLRSASGGHDPMEEEVGVHSVRIGSLSIVLLEQNPGFNGPYESPASSMHRSISEDYFSQLARHAPNGLANKDFETLNSIFVSCCAQDHIRLVMVSCLAVVQSVGSIF